MVRVLFVCTGNICRSPTAEGVFRALVDQAGLSDRITTDSAGTHGYHIGECPDKRSCVAATARGYALDELKARQVVRADFERFDMVVAMDRGHYSRLRALCLPGQENRVYLFMRFAPQFGALDVPDPYYGEGDGFELVLDMIEAGCEGLLNHIRDTML